MSRKRGTFSKEEERIVSENDILSDAELAKMLNRSPETVRTYRNKIIGKAKIDENGDLIEQLHQRHYWPTIKRQLLPEEVIFFEQEWSSLINQFSTHDILHTDELMVQDLIICTIMLNRLMERKRMIEEYIHTLEEQLNIQMKIDIQMRDAGVISQIRSEMNSYMGALEANSKECVTLQTRKSQLFKDLKSTRDQRLKLAEESKTNIWLKFAQLNERKERQKEGRYIGLVALSADKEERRLSELVEFEDKMLDRPFLIPEVIEKENEKDDEVQGDT